MLWRTLFTMALSLRSGFVVPQIPIRSLGLGWSTSSADSSRFVFLKKNSFVPLSKVLSRHFPFVLLEAKQKKSMFLYIILMPCISSKWLQCLQYESWTKKEPNVMWLSGLHIPESYLTALVQTACRKNEWPLDKSDLFTEVTSYDSNTKPEDLPAGYYVSGLYLEGAGWDKERGCLTRQRPKEMVAELPLLRIIPVEAHRLKTQGSFKTPVYVTQRRRNAMAEGGVFDAYLATMDHSSHWILQGVCVCLNLD